MKKCFLLGAIVSVLAASVSPAWADVTAPKDLPDGMQFTVDGGTLRIRFQADDVARVTYANAAQVPEIKSLAVVATPANVKWTKQETGQAFTLVGPRLKVKVDKQSGVVSFLDSADTVLLRETAQGRAIAPQTQYNIQGNSCAQSFELPADEGIYGLGQHQQGAWNSHSGTVRLAQSNMNVGIPVITSSKGYTLLWDNPAITAITSSENAVKWSSEFGKAIDYYFCFNDGTIDGAMKAYRHLTGEAPLMPKWELGFWQCKERYFRQDELLGVAKRLREMKVPVDGIIQDWQYWPDGAGNWGSHKFDPARYPDPEGMFKDLKAMNYHTLISVWAKFDVGSDNSKELNEKGGMFPTVVRYVYPPGQGQWYDPFADVGREIYWKQMRDQLFSKGVDGWWLDAPEPEIGAQEWRGYTSPLGPMYSTFNAYPLMHSKGIYEGQRAATSEKRVVILTRSAYAGQQRNSAITWSGDIGSGWTVFKNQVPAGLNFALSGIPYWNTDTGGFSNDRTTGNMTASDPRYAEIFTRWFQFSSFCGMMRVHGGYGADPNKGKEIWRFPEATQQVLRKYLDVRYRLMPYTYSQAWQVTSNAATLMRPLVMDFPKDKEVLNIGNEYLWGPSILVTPVTTQGATTQSVYLPATNGAWYDFWTGATTAGGKRGGGGGDD